MGKCYVELVYDSTLKPLPVAITDDLKTVVIVKRQVLKEARERHEQAKGMDTILEIEFLGALRKLENTLNMLIPPEMEELALTENEEVKG